MKAKFTWLTIIFLTFILTVSCTDSSQKNDKRNEGNSQINKVRTKPPSSFSDTVTVDFPVAVFYNSDSLQLKKIKAVTDSMIFKGTMHDCFYQMRNSRTILKQYYPKVKVKEVVNGRYILFKKSDGKVEIIDLNTKNDPCGLFIFDGQKLPLLVDMTNIDTDLGFYFLK
jgi:hypothetical protein